MQNVNNNALVKWQTTNEINVSHFNIQRSTNGKDFTAIAKVLAKNKSENEYGFIDPIGNLELGIRNLYYRIESVDKDGKSSYSVVRNLVLGIRNNEIKLFPNPAKDLVNIECAGAKQILIIDYLGQTIKQLNNATEHQTINTKQFPKGIYIVKAIMKNGEIKTTL